MSESERALGRLPEAEARARDAIAMAARMGARRNAWRAWAALAEALRAQGRAREAGDAIARARAEIAYASEQAGREDLRRSFLALPAIKALLEES